MSDGEAGSHGEGADDLWGELGALLQCAAFERRGDSLRWTTQIDGLLPDTPQSPPALAEHAIASDRDRVMEAFRRCACDTPVNLHFRSIVGKRTRTLELILREGHDTPVQRGLLRDVTHDPDRLARDHFQYIVSHDLMEPIRTIRSFIDLTLDEHGEKLDEQGQHFLGIAAEGALRMRGLLESLLRWTRLGAHAPTEDVDPATSAREATLSLARLLEETLVELTILPMPRVRANPLLLRLAFENLLSNAVRFRSPDRPLAVHISGEACTIDGRDWVEIRVRDNGIGVPAEQRDHAFEVFRRLAPQRHPLGAGMGLAIVRRIIDQSAGTIHLEDPREQQGLVVVVRLPAG
jgi:signal transduction histidine kinase